MMMTQLRLNFASQQVRRDVADPYEMHRTIQRLLDGSEERPLWRLHHDAGGTHAVMLLQTERTPQRIRIDELDPEYLLAFDSRHNRLLENMAEDDLLHFRLWANPTVTREGKRHGLVNYEDQISWIERVFSGNGALISGVQAGAAQRITGGRRRRSRPIVITGVQFDGRLRVQDSAALRSLVIRGAGPAKSFGFGLITLAR